MDEKETLEIVEESVKKKKLFNVVETLKYRTTTILFLVLLILRWTGTMPLTWMAVFTPTWLGLMLNEPYDLVRMFKMYEKVSTKVLDTLLILTQVVISLILAQYFISKFGRIDNVNGETMILIITSVMLIMRDTMRLFMKKGRLSQEIEAIEKHEREESEKSRGRFTRDFIKAYDIACIILVTAVITNIIGITNFNWFKIFLLVNIPIVLVLIVLIILGLIMLIGRVVDKKKK